MVKTSPFHGEDTGSNPVGVTIKIGTANYISYGIVNPRVVSSSLTRSAYGATVAQLVEQVKTKNLSCIRRVVELADTRDFDVFYHSKGDTTYYK